MCLTRSVQTRLDLAVDRLLSLAVETPPIAPEIPAKGRKEKEKDEKPRPSTTFSPSIILPKQKKRAFVLCSSSPPQKSSGSSSEEKELEPSALFICKGQSRSEASSVLLQLRSSGVLGLDATSKYAKAPSSNPWTIAAKSTKECSISKEDVAPSKSAK